MSIYAQNVLEEKNNKGNKKEDEEIMVIVKPEPFVRKPGEKYEDGLTVLEALSATGLRSIRYAKEVPGINKIVANDISFKAVESIRSNLKDNGVEHLIECSQNDAT